MVKKVELLNTLKDLTEEEFVEFKWHLKDESLAGYQTIKASQLQNAERRDTVDLMVKTYQLPGAVEVTKKLLKTINRNDLLQSLSETSSGPEVDVSADLEASENRGPSSCQTHPLLEVSTIIIHSEDNINDKESSENRGPSSSQPLTDNSQSEDTSAATKLKALKVWLVPLVILVILVVLMCLAFTHLLASKDGTVGIGVALPELKRVQQYAVDVTLDPDTAHPNLTLSADGKEANYGDVMKKNLPDNSKRFLSSVNVLGKQSFFSGKFYFEVQVRGESCWDLGVARESINREKKITLSPENGYWTITWRNTDMYWSTYNGLLKVTVEDTLPQEVGVFVDYEEGLVSFYNLKCAALVSAFTGCSFTEKLYPVFSPCPNDSGRKSRRLSISPVNQPT